MFGQLQGAGLFDVAVGEINKPPDSLSANEIEFLHFLFDFWIKLLLPTNFRWISDFASFFTGGLGTVLGDTAPAS